MVKTINGRSCLLEVYHEVDDYMTCEILTIQGNILSCFSHIKTCGPSPGLSVRFLFLNQLCTSYFTIFIYTAVPPQDIKLLRKQCSCVNFVSHIYCAVARAQQVVNECCGMNEQKMKPST